MKLKFLLLSAFAFSLSVSSCKKDDEKPSNPLIGTWIYTTDTATNCTDPDDDYTESFSCTTTDCNKITFKADGTYSTNIIVDGDTYLSSGTYTISGNTFTLCRISDCHDPLTFGVNGSTLTFTGKTSLGCTEINTYIKG